MKRIALLAFLTAAPDLAVAEGILICQLKTDRWLIYDPYTLCLSGYGEISARSLYTEERTRTAGGYLGQLYGSAALGHWVSVHARGGFKRLADPDTSTILTYRRTEHAFVQLGHPISDPFYMSLGRIDAPFGLNHDLYRLSLPSHAQSLWISSIDGGRFGFGWRDELRLELGSNVDKAEGFEAGERKIFSGRIIKSIDLLTGTKLLGSYATSSDFKKRYMGLASLVQNNDNRTSLEWIRLTDSDIPEEFEQVFRMAHEQQELGWSWNWVMEDVRHDSYRLSFGATKPWVGALSSTLSIHYQKENERPRDHWIILAGLVLGSAWTWEEKTP